MIIPGFEDKGLAEEIKKILSKGFLKENGSFANIGFSEKPSQNFDVFLSDSKDSVKAKIGFGEDQGFFSVSSRISAFLAESVEKSQLNPQNIVLLGTSMFGKQEYGFAKQHNIKLFSAREITFEGLADVCDAAMSALRSIQKGFLFSISLDALDCSFSKSGVPGGISPRELVYIVQRMKNLRNMASAEVIGIGSETVDLAAKLAVELA